MDIFSRYPTLFRYMGSKLEVAITEMQQGESCTSRVHIYICIYIYIRDE